MSLRQELSLFFGGLLLVVLSLVVGLNYVSLKNTLEMGLKKQFSPRAYLQVAQGERQLNLERSRTLVTNQIINTYRRNVLGQMDTGGKEALGKARKKDPAFSSLHSELSTLYDQSLGLFSGETNDLVVLSAADGTVLLEALSVSAKVADFDVTTMANDLSQEQFWDSALLRGELKGYLVYPDGKLYLVGASWFQKGPYFDGLAVVGTAVDREFLDTVATDSLVCVLYGDKVVGANEEANSLGTDMLKEKTEVGQESWVAPNGKTYLVKSESLWSFYPATPDNAGAANQERPTEVGRIVFLRDMAEVEAAAFQQSRLSLLLGLAALAVALLLVPLLARRFTGPVGALSKAMTEVGRGHLEQIPSEHISSIREVRQASVSFNQMVIGLRQKRALETFVPEGTRAEVEASQGATPELGGQRLERTILFSDLRGFTSMSERLPATQVMDVLNLYLECMTRAIRLAGGDINEYIGDAILAVFASPDAAVRAAQAMCRELDRLHQDAEVEELQGLGQGIGIHTGPIVEGNIGEKNARLKRAVVGDTVNLAARIQDRSRDGRFTCIFLSGDTKAKLSEEFPLEFFGDEQFKGKAELIPVWEVSQS